MDDLIFQRLTPPLEPSQHRASTTDRDLPLEKAIRDVNVCRESSRFLASINRKRNQNTALLTLPDGRVKSLKKEFLSPVQDRLGVEVGRIAIH